MTVTPKGGVTIIENDERKTINTEGVLSANEAFLYPHICEVISPFGDARIITPLPGSEI